MCELKGTVRRAALLAASLLLGCQGGMADLTPEGIPSSKADRAEAVLTRYGVQTEWVVAKEEDKGRRRVRVPKHEKARALRLVEVYRLSEDRAGLQALLQEAITKNLWDEREVTTWKLAELLNELDLRDDIEGLSTDVVYVAVDFTVDEEQRGPLDPRPVTPPTASVTVLYVPNAAGGRDVAIDEGRIRRMTESRIAYLYPENVQVEIIPAVDPARMLPGAVEAAGGGAGRPRRNVMPLVLAGAGILGLLVVLAQTARLAGARRGAAAAPSARAEAGAEPPAQPTV